MRFRKLSFGVSDINDCENVRVFVLYRRKRCAERLQNVRNVSLCHCAQTFASILFQLDVAIDAINRIRLG